MPGKSSDLHPDGNYLRLFGHKSQGCTVGINPGCQNSDMEMHYVRSESSQSAQLHDIT